MQTPEILQCEAIKTIFMLPPCTPSVDLYQNFKILESLKIRNVQNCIYMHKLVNGNLPFAELLKFHSRAQTVSHLTTASKDGDIFDIPSYRLTPTNKSYLALAPKSWNKLPKHIRTETDSNVFKVFLKDHVLATQSCR